MASIRDLVSDPEGKGDSSHTTQKKNDNPYEHPTAASHYPPPDHRDHRRRESSSSTTSSPSFAQPPPPHHPHYHPHYYDHHHPRPHPGSGYPYPPPPPPGADYQSPPHYYPYHQPSPPHGPPYHGYHHPPYHPPPPGRGYHHPPPHGYPPAPVGTAPSPSSSSHRGSEEKPSTSSAGSTVYHPLAPKHATSSHTSHLHEGGALQHPTTHGPESLKKDQPHPPAYSLHGSHSRESASSHPPSIKTEDEEVTVQHQPGTSAVTASADSSHAALPPTHNPQHHEGLASAVAGSTSSATRRSIVDQDWKSSSRRFRIKIVQQPLHARMCGFGEKDRRPIDPPPIVQLIMENDGEDGEGDEKGDSLSQQGKGPKKHGGSGKKSRKRSISEQWICNDLPPKLLASSRKAAAAAAAAAAAGKSSVKQQDAPSHYPGGTDGGGGHARNGDVDGHGKVSQASSSTADKGDVEMTDADETAHTASTASRRVTEPSAPVRHGSHSHDEEEEHDELDEDDIPSSHSKEQSGEVHYIEDEDDDGDDEQVSFLQQDPLFVLHASLWSEDGSQVRSMIATPGQQDPPKLTRILMGSIVVSPILLNNTQGEPGWYFSFPDLSIRTEGVYTLKFSLLRFGSFNFNVEDSGKHASEVIDEAISQPFTVFSAKKFPGMTESTELSKTFAKQGLKIPIRNDLRVRKADRD